MLKIKKLGATLLSIVMSLHIIPDSLLASKQTYAADNMETTKYVLPIQKNCIEALEIEVYEQNEKYYTIPQNIALLTGATYTDGERCPVYGGQSFTFTRGMFEVSVDAENQKMYSCLTEYDYSIRKTLNSKLSLVNSYLNLHDPIYDFTEFDEKITDEMIEQVDLPDEIKDVFLNEPEFSLETYALDNTDISVVEIDSTYMIELIPWLMYMGAECNTSDECLEVNMPYRTLWESIMADLHENTHNKVQAEKSTAHNVWDVSCSVFVDIISDIPGFIKYAFTDTWNSVTGQQSGDKYVEEAIYDILKVDYSNSQQINDKVEAINEFVGLANSDVINASASIYEFAYDEYDSYLPYLTNYIPNDKYEELCDRAIKMENLKNNTEALKFVLGCVVTINEKLNYSDDTKKSLNNVLGKNIDSYVNDDSDGKWTDTARRVMKDIDSTENIVTGAILKEGIDFLFDKGKDEGLALFGKQNYATLSFDLAKSLLINAPMFRPVWEGYDAQLYMIEQNEIQMDMLQLIDSLVRKAIITERCSNSTSLTELADALKFYYRAVIAHANNSVKYLEEVDMFNENQDALIKEYKSLSEMATEYLYNVSNCTVTPIKKYNSLKNDIITEEWVKQFIDKDVIINEVLENEQLYKNDFEMWFQDFDFDGICELIVGNGCFHEGYYFDGNNLVRITQHGQMNENISNFDYLRLYYDLETSLYGFYQEMGVTNWYGVSDVSYSNEELTSKNIVSRIEGEIEYGVDWAWYNSNGREISQNEYAELYNAYVKDLVEYSYTIDKIKLSEFNELSDSKKYERLKKSYDAFVIGGEIGEIEKYKPIKDGSNLNEKPPIVTSNNKTEFNSVPELYLNNESSWLYNSSNPFAVFWFQDLDFDGINEMIYGFEVDQFSGNVFSVWENSIGGNQFGISGGTAKDSLDLCYDEKNQDYFYINRDPAGFGDEKTYYTIYKYQYMWMESIVGYIIENNEKKTYYGLHDSDHIYNSASISVEEYVRIYNEFVANLRYVDYTTEIIQVSDYINASKDERLALLQKSYNAFHIGDIKERVSLISVSDVK